MENEKYRDCVFAAGNLEDELEEILTLSERDIDGKRNDNFMWIINNYFLLTGIKE